MHDREKGLRAAQHEVLPTSYETNCLFHLSKNVRLKFSIVASYARVATALGHVPASKGTSPKGAKPLSTSDLIQNEQAKCLTFVLPELTVALLASMDDCISMVIEHIALTLDLFNKRDYSF
ncbi:hypothetical protein H4219_002945 [Mycoemilia scoparia]|uniref:Uncharacterized protein n=1 Tax=Mycoemilia scoparia TaxID=417184 RepID=A0A9W7ZW79_9FUNG|nr:hypothetical protein H4219_002945 [Mycoemilia scoparia]